MWTLTALTYDNYDEGSLTDTPGIAGHDSSLGTGFTVRGNHTSQNRWVNPSNSYVTSKSTYDIAGNVRTSTDPVGNATTYGFTDGAFAQPTSVTNPLNQTTSYVYDGWSRKLVWVTDINKVVTNYLYNDVADRITQVRRAAGSGIESQTKYVYMGPNWTYQQSDQTTKGDGVIRNDVAYDGFGRVNQTASYEDTWSKYISVWTGYDAMGRVSSKTNPTRTTYNSGTGAWNDGLGYGTRYAYDALGRATTVTAQDGTQTTMSYRGNSVTTTDSAGKQQVHTSDALGRLTNVIEDAGGTRASTSYTYDALDNLTAVTQGTCPSCVQRSFTYDSLSRLLQANNPESGTVKYGYDANGNLHSKTDARNISTTYLYDAVNRLLSKTYSDSTAAARYWYATDPATYSAGRLGWYGIDKGPGATFSYDALGRVIQSVEGSSQTYYTSYSYNLAGAVTSQTYPSGRVVTTKYDGANRPTDVYQNGNFVSGASVYAAHGAFQSYWLSNSVVRTFAFNTRLQPTEIADSVAGQVGGCQGPSGTGQPAFVSDIKLYWGDSATQTQNNNGNLRGQLINTCSGATVNNYWEMFGYDGFNRLTTASDNGGSQWIRNYSYDNFGNMWTPNPSGGPLSGFTPQTNLFNLKNQVSGWGYDAAGNLIQDGTFTLTYDAEGRQISAKDTVTGGVETYTYDAQGQRVQESSSSGNTNYVYDNYVYDAAGQLTAQYSSNPTAAPCSICYLSTDHLGTVRMVTDINGKIIGHHDYLPFGEEVQSGQAGRTSVWGSGNDNIAQKFTGKERDSSTGLDLFGARYYGSALGRFTSPDSGGPIPNQPDPVPWADLENPQSLNLYAYGLNNPLANVDDDGHDVNVCLNDENGNQHCTQMTNEQYAAASQGNAGTNAPTLNQVGMNGDGNGNFNATNITDSNGNTIGTATYVSNGGADYYANRNGIDMLATNARTMNDPRTYALWLGASATAGYGLYAAGAFEGGLTTLEIGAETGSGIAPTAGQAAQAERVLAQNGRKSVEKAIRTLERRIAEHEAKIQNATGHTSSMDREIQNFKQLIQAYKDVLGK